MMIAVGFISSSSSLPIMWRVESFSGTCSDTTSEVRSSSRSRRNFTPCWSASSSERRAMSKYCTCMPNGARQPRHLLADGAEADDAERLVVQLVHARRRPVAAPAPARHAAVLPDHLAVDREHQHHGVLGDRDRVGAAIVRERHLGAPRGLEVDIVVAGAEQLHELELRHRLVELIPHRHVRIADHVFGAGQDADTSAVVVTTTVSKPFGAISRAMFATSAEGDTTRILGDIADSLLREAVRACSTAGILRRDGRVGAQYARYVQAQNGRSPLIVQRRITRTWFASSKPVARCKVQRLSHTMHWRGDHTCV